MAGRAVKTKQQLDDALTAIYELLCEVEKRVPDVEAARLASNAIAWCKTHKEPEWTDRWRRWKSRGKKGAA